MLTGQLFEFFRVGLGVVFVVDVMFMVDGASSLGCELQQASD